LASAVVASATSSSSSSTSIQQQTSNNLANLLTTLQQQHNVDLSQSNGADPNSNSAAVAATLAALLHQQQQKLNLPVGFSNNNNNNSQAFSNNSSGVSSMPSSSSSSTNNNSNSNAVSPSLQQQQQQPQQQQQQQSTNQQPSVSTTPTTNQETFIQPILGVAPLGKSPLTKEQNQQLAILDCAFKKLPQPSDTERIRSYFPRMQVNSPSYYPLVPPNGHDSIEFLCKLHSDTLFFMFYYMEGTKAQFLAAQALKRLSWRYHTRYMMWFQRFEEPKIITDEYETGTYVLFDFEKWISRRKEDFTFEYKYLEDRDLSAYQ